MQTDAKGQTQTMTYDGLGRILTRIDKRTNGSTEGSSVWTYDSSPYGLGQLDNVQDTISGYMKSVLYDTLGRVDEVITSFDAGVYYEKSTYDQYGRPYQVFDAAGDGSYSDQAVVNSYNAYGYLESIGDAVLVGGLPRTIYRSIVAMNARGQVTSERRGIDNTDSNPEPSVSTMYLFDDATGRLLSIDGINAAGLDVQDLDYTWDNLGNLQTRDEMSGTKNLSESFTYDGLNRLTSQAVSGQTSVTVSYDGIGNITEKTDVGLYQYSVTGTRPHAVTSAGGVVYGYDANGNNTSGDGRSIQYTTFDKPDEITKGIHTTSFAYGPDRARYRRIDSGTNGTTTTRYIGNVEIIFQANGDQDRKRYIAGVAIETIHFGSNSIEDYRETHYLHKDHLGSLDVITDTSGNIVQEQSFDAWGQRRDASTWQALPIIQLTAFNHSVTTRGFTGHEMLDEVGVIHMNGRIYDPKLGRFLQADPFVQDPLNTQSLNRYSYVLNNPLNATDPSGHLVSLIVGAILAIKGGIDVAVVAMWVAGAAITDTLIAGGNLTDALLAGLSAAAFAGVGGELASLGSGFAATTARVFVFGTLGGMTSVLQGGRFGNGFKSAGIATLTSAAAGKASSGVKTEYGKMAIAVTAGGTASALTGGKFANGALSVGFTLTVLQGHQAFTSDAGTVYEVTLGEESADGPSFSRSVVDDPRSAGIVNLSVNGQSNDLELAIKNGYKQLGRPSKFHVYHNPTKTGFVDTVESILGKTKGPSSLARGLAEILTGNTDTLLNVASHSQGTIIVSNALALIPGQLSEQNTFSFFGPAASRSWTRSAVESAGANPDFGQWKSNRYDFVGNVIGGGANNIGQWIGSVLAAPLLFTPYSPHSNYAP